MIVIEPSHGLCNRLRAIKSAMNLAKKYNQKLVVLWRVDNDLTCRFFDLFEPIPNVLVKDLSFLYKERCWLKRKIFSNFVLTQGDIQGKNLMNEALDDYIMANKVFEKNNTLYIKTFSDFYSLGDTDYSWLKPIKAVQKEIDEINANFENFRKIGVHIRRTDNEWAIKNSPEELFFDAISKEIALDNNCKIYLATDDNSLKKVFQDRFSEKVITNDNCVIERTSVEGMRQGVVDLFLLATSNIIYGSFWSSFSEEAAKIGKCELKIIKK